MAINSLSLVTSANASVNQLRRDMLRPNLARKYQLLCNSTPKPPSKLLLGDNLADGVKQANATSSLMTRGIGRGRTAARGRHHPYAPMPGPYQYGYQPYMMPGVQGQYRPRGRGFFGEYQNYVVLKDTEAIKNVFPSVYDKNTNVSPLFHPRPKQPGDRVMEQEGQRGQVKQELIQLKRDNQLGTAKPVGESSMECNLTKWGNEFHASRVSLCVDAWAKITSDPDILSNIRRFKFCLNEKPYQHKPMQEIKFSDQENKFVREEINSLLKKGVLTKAIHTPG